MLMMSLLIIKHFICDFVLQTNKMIYEKADYGAKGGIYHAIEHAIGTGIVLCFFFYNLWAAMIFALIDGILHYHIDWVKQNYSGHYDPRDKQFWIWIGADQMCHYLTYVVIVWCAVVL
jgi:hypothetical protein